MSTEHTLAENLIRLQEATEDIADAITEKGGTASYSDGLEAMASKILLIPTPQPILITKSIASNGTYNASSDNADGYSSVTVNVPNTYSSSDNGKVVQNGALVSQTSTTKTENGIYDTTTNNSVTVNVTNAAVAKELTVNPGKNTTFYFSEYHNADPLDHIPYAFLCGNILSFRVRCAQGYYGQYSVGDTIVTVSDNLIKDFSSKTAILYYAGRHSGQTTLYGGDGYVLSDDYRDYIGFSVNYTSGTVTFTVKNSNLRSSAMNIDFGGMIIWT